MKTQIIEIIRSDHHFGFAVRFAMDVGDQRYVADPATMRSHIEGEIIPNVFELNPNSMQALADQLWDLGFRPKRIVEGEKDEIMKARMEHLHDLRVLMGERCAVKLV